MSREFRLDRRNGKLLGLFAGAANYTGIDATILRIGFIVLTLAGGWHWTIAAYFAACWGAVWAAKKSGIDRSSERPASGSINDLHTTMTETDRKLAEVERYVASPNNSLAREIDALR